MRVREHDASVRQHRLAVRKAERDALEQRAPQMAAAMMKLGGRVIQQCAVRGLEVEGQETFQPTFSDVAVGEILEVERPSGAEKLLLCRVDVGRDVLPIVCGASNIAVGNKVPVALRDPYHQPHLQNFFNAVRGKATLNCPAEIGYESAVTVIKVNEAIDAGVPLSFKPEDFKV